jgi:hypothetical protein
VSEPLPHFLAGFVPEADWCAANGDICQRTCARYRNQPDGLPFVYFGGQVWIGPADQAREWLLRRVIQRNPAPKKRRPAA